MVCYLPRGKQPPSPEVVQRRKDAVERYLNYCEDLNLSPTRGHAWFGLTYRTVKGYVHRRVEPQGRNVQRMEMICTHLKHLYDNKIIPVNTAGIGKNKARTINHKIVNAYLAKIGFYNPIRVIKGRPNDNPKFLAKRKSLKPKTQKATDI